MTNQLKGNKSAKTTRMESKEKGETVKTITEIIKREQMINEQVM